MCKVLNEKQVLDIIKSKGKYRESLLSILLEIQHASGENYIQEEWAKMVANELDLPLTKVYEVLTFYAMFSTTPRGKYVITICNSTPCRVSKSDEIVKIFENELNIKMGETTPDKLFTLMYTQCVGACDIGPVAQIGEDVYGNLTRDKITDIIKSYRGDEKCQKF